MNTRVVVLVSAGQHPLTGRARRSPQDARVLELALSLSGIELDILHAGDPESGALRQYLGMGLERMQVLEVPKNCNPYPALLWALGEQEFDLILTGVNNFDGANSGLVPYALGRDLDRPVISNACEVSLKNNRIHVLQSLPKGRRRLMAARLPAIVAIPPVIRQLISERVIRSR